MDLNSHIKQAFMKILRFIELISYKNLECTIIASSRARRLYWLIEYKLALERSSDLWHLS